MKLNNNIKLLLYSILIWFILSIILILLVKNSMVLSIIFIIISITLVLIIYRVLYAEFCNKKSEKYIKKLEKRKNANDK